MSFSVATLGKKRKSLTFEYEVEEGEKQAINLVYTPQGYNAQLEMQIRLAVGQPLRQAELGCQMLSRLLVSWNVVRPKLRPVTEPARDLEGELITTADGEPVMVPVTDADGSPVMEPVLDEAGNPVEEPYPHDINALRELSSEFINACCTAISEDVRPKKDAKRD